MSGDRRDIARTRSEVRRGWWPGWIWAIPIAALLLVGWWAFRTFLTGGEDITIAFDDAHGLKAKSTAVTYRGMEIGTVTGVALAKDGSGVVVTADIADEAKPFLRAGTQFWLRGAHPSFADLSSLSAVMSGPTIVMEPGPGNATRHFTGITHRPIISGAQGLPQVYRVLLNGDAGRLREGDPVKLRGFTIGEVESIGFRYDAGSGTLETPVTVALYPSLFHVARGSASSGRTALAAAIERLIREGLHAGLKRDPPLIGDPEIALDIAPGESGAPPPAIDGVAQIPAESGGGLDSLADRVNKLPLDQIAQNLLDTTHRVDALVASPALNDAISQLDAMLAQLHQMTNQAAPQIDKLVDTLRRTAGELDNAARAAGKTADTAQQAARSADNILGGAPSQNGVPDAMREITEAARSVRELADYLDRHPEALVKGRSGE